MELHEKNVCIYCGNTLSKWENTRSYCWNCNELSTSESFGEEHSSTEDAPLFSEQEYEEYPHNK